MKYDNKYIQCIDYIKNGKWSKAKKGSTTVTMAYDYAGRRISKTVTVSGVVQNAYKYVYDGFKLIAVYNNNDLVMTFTWQPESLGMDVPVSMTYAGATYYYVTDGNKNVTALLDASGNRVAEYVYGPFGQTVSATGSMAQINPFRFSSEFHDDETGLVYYNYRYYSPELGRWTKRDPIGESGGMNTYINTQNSLINLFDYLGLWSPEGLIKSYEQQYGYDALQKFFLWVGEGGKVSCASTWFDDWYIEGKTIYIATTWWLGSERSDANAAHQLNEALAIHCGIGKTSLGYKIGRTLRGLGKMTAGGLSVAGGLYVSGASAGTLSYLGSAVAFFGGNTFVEGVTQVAGHDKGGFNPTAELIYQVGLLVTDNEEYANYGKAGYYIVDFSVSTISGIMSYRSIFNIKKGYFTRFHTPYKEGTGVGPLLKYTKDFKPIYKYVPNQRYRIQVTGSTIEGSFSGYSAIETLKSMEELE